MGRTTTSPSTTTGFFRVVPTPRIAASGGFQIALARVGLDEKDGGSNLEFLKGIGKVPEVTDWPAKLAEVGMTVTDLTPEQMAVLMKKTQSVRDAWRSKIGEELVKAAEEDMASVAK